MSRLNISYSNDSLLNFGDLGDVFPVVTDKHGPNIALYALLFGCCVLLLASNIAKPREAVDAPYVGYRSFFEPAWLVRLRFSKGALPQINEGYQKFKKSIFKVSRNDKDLVVISNKYVDELRNLAEDKLNSIEALIANICGKYTASEIMLEGNLHTRLIQTKLTPNLAAYTSTMREVVEREMQTVIPKDRDGWVEVRIYDIIGLIIARISNRIFLGEEDCKNDDWFYASIGYSKEVTFTIMVIRMLPLWLRPVAAWFLPSSWRLHSHLRTAKRALVPVIARRRESEKQFGYQKPDDFLQWMMDAAKGEERRPEKLAHRQLILILASVHTTTMAGAHAIYDLCARPEYFEPLREEVDSVVNEAGGSWGKTTLTKMRKMDSFMRESQRRSPASLLGFHRIVKKPIDLSDGTHLPPGTHICLASEATSNDPQYIPNADVFDGFRYYKMREQPEETHKHQFATTDKNHLHFGHGKYACPGRFFASNELKVVISNLLTEFDMKFPEGGTRPANLNADEFLYSDPSTSILIKRRNIEKTN